MTLQKTRNNIYDLANCPQKPYCNLLKMRIKMSENSERPMREKRSVLNLIYSQCWAEKPREMNSCPILSGKAKNLHLDDL
ncbi:hypothetical protein GF378_01025 [Candidatus Pacearchaeota archaeon]|nr:hypothetical protein [Candidatus Pacearchaeota archaeon]